MIKNILVRIVLATFILGFIVGWLSKSTNIEIPDPEIIQLECVDTMYIGIWEN